MSSYWDHQEESPPAEPSSDQVVEAKAQLSTVTPGVSPKLSLGARYVQGRAPSEVHAVTDTQDSDPSKIASEVSEELRKTVLSNEVADTRKGDKNLGNDSIGEDATSNEQVVGKGEGQRCTRISPEMVLVRILAERGYPTEAFPALSPAYVTVPTEDMTKAYDMEFVRVIHKRDMVLLRSLKEAGRNMNACNKFGESLLHMAMRRGEIEIVRFMVQNGAVLMVCDDQGRTPLHDACWGTQPYFELVRIVLDRNRDMIRVKDRRGFTPLSYVRRESWVEWCCFLEEIKDVYWPHQLCQKEVDQPEGEAERTASPQDPPDCEATPEG
ncbi:unnamed protein product [Choristocarpus tenellus]